MGSTRTAKNRHSEQRVSKTMTYFIKIIVLIAVKYELKIYLKKENKKNVKSICNGEVVLVCVCVLIFVNRLTTF